MGTRTMLRLALGICIVSAVSAQYQQNSLHRGPDKDNGRYRPQYSNNHFQTSTPAPSDPSKFAKIMKQINKVNDDGSYTFGFENDDGSFRVETRTKDGLVKGKYGFVDANGQLKVTEYTAGEKSDDSSDTNDDLSDTTESEEDGGDFKRPRNPGPVQVRSQPLSSRPPARSYNPRPQQPQFPQYIPRQLPLDSRPVPSATPAPYRVGARAVAFDQAPAAQTAQEKVARAPPTSEDDFRESSEDDGDSFSKRQSGSQEDNLNGQYFRTSVTPSGGGGGSSPGNRGRFPGSGSGNSGSSGAGRPLYSGAGGPSAYAQQYPGGFSPSQGGRGQYNFGAGGPQGFPGGPGGPQGFPGGPGGPQGFPGGPQGFPGGQPGYDIPPGFIGSQQGGFAPAFPQQGGPQGFRQLQGAPQDFSSIGNLQGGRSPQGGQRSPQNLQSIQNFGGFEGFNTRQGPTGQGGKGSDEGRSGERYVPSVELDGYSEDLDQDGYPDDPPKDGKLPLKSGTSSGSSPNYRPSALGPQGLGIQGGIQGGRPGQGPSGPAGISPQGQIILQLGAQGNPQEGFGGGRFPGSGPQHQQRQQGGFQGQQGGGGGLPPHYVPQQSFGGFPQGGVEGGFPQQGFPQGFPQAYEGGQGFPQQFSPQGGQGGQYSGEGFPYDFNPYSGGGQGFQPSPQGFQGSPQGLPFGATGPTAPYPQQANYPGVQNFGDFPGGAGGSQGFPLGGHNRFSSGGGGGGSSPNGAQSFLSGGQYGNLSGLGQSSPTPGGASSSPSSAETKKA